MCPKEKVRQAPCYRLDTNGTTSIPLVRKGFGEWQCANQDCRLRGSQSRLHLLVPVRFGKRNGKRVVLACGS